VYCSKSLAQETSIRARIKSAEKRIIERVVFIEFWLVEVHGYRRRVSDWDPPNFQLSLARLVGIYFFVHFVGQSHFPRTTATVSSAGELITSAILAPGVHECAEFLRIISDRLEFGQDRARIAAT
jgi:hypothetical protein